MNRASLCGILACFRCLATIRECLFRRSEKSLFGCTLQVSRFLEFRNCEPRFHERNQFFLRNWTNKYWSMVRFPKNRNHGLRFLRNWLTSNLLHSFWRAAYKGPYLNDVCTGRGEESTDNRKSRQKEGKLLGFHSHKGEGGPKI